MSSVCLGCVSFSLRDQFTVGSRSWEPGFSLKAETQLAEIQFKSKLDEGASRLDNLLPQLDTKSHCTLFIA